MARYCYKKITKSCVCLVAFIALVNLFWSRILVQMQEILPCSETESQKIHQQMCKDFESGLLMGDLCSPLCKDKSGLQCLNHAVGKVTLKLTLSNGKKVVLKSERGNFSEYKRTIEPMLKHIEDKKYLDHLAARYPLDTLDYNYFESSMVSYNKKLHNKKSLHVWRLNLWALLSQPEFVVTKFMENHSHIPRIMGVCGHFYGLEYLPQPSFMQNLPVGVRKHGFHFKKADWSEKAEMALQLLDLIQEFDTTRSGYLHICDMKGDNFGIGEEKILKLIDLDMVLSSKTLSNYFSQLKCEDDADCKYKYCYGTCNKAKQKCSSTRQNSNLQVACTHIFRRHYLNVYSGLLDNPPDLIKSDLSEAVTECIHTARSPQDQANMDKYLSQKMHDFISVSLKKDYKKQR